LREIGVNFRTQVGINGRIADFLIGDTNIVLETDGLYWHCDAIIKEAAHHAIKRNHYIRNGYLPLFFREDEIYNKPAVVQSIIRNKVGGMITTDNYPVALKFSELVQEAVTELEREKEENEKDAIFEDENQMVDISQFTTVPALGSGPQEI
jgi:hypothetical protein